MKSAALNSGLGFWALILLCSPAKGQFLNDNPVGQWFEPILSRDVDIMAMRSNEPFAAYRSSRIHLFNMPSALPGDPLGIMPDSDLYADDAAGSTGESPDDRFQLVFGADNPFFDLRRHGDPGGVGYYRMYSQMCVLDSSRWSLSMVLQGVTPAGLEADGIATGPTILSPSLASYYELAPGTGIHAFIGKDVEAHSGWTREVRQDIRYGVALQTPCPSLEEGVFNGVHLYLEALGRYRVDDSGNRPPPKFDVLPGLHWQVSDNWWMTGGLLMPLSSQRWDGHLWQFTCAWRY
jgi:hypothetical protein